MTDVEACELPQYVGERHELQGDVMNDISHMKILNSHENCSECGMSSDTDEDKVTFCFSS